MGTGHSTKCTSGELLGHVSAPACGEILCLALSPSALHGGLPPVGVPLGASIHGLGASIHSADARHALDAGGGTEPRGLMPPFRRHFQRGLPVGLPRAGPPQN